MDPSQVSSVYTGTKLELPSSFRLLKLHDYSDQQPLIECTLQSFNQADNPRYRALSYTWGPAIVPPVDVDLVLPPESLQEITCNGQSFLVTKNLHDALSEFCRSGFPDWLWVDAICIDQTNLREREHQVTMMGQIYASAIETVAWLGEDEHRVEDIQWATTVMVLEMLRRGPIFCQGLILTDPVLSDMFGVPDINERLIRIMTFLARRSWFKRAWVAQEVALAQTIRICCGGTRFSWTALNNLGIVLHAVAWGQETVPENIELRDAYSSTMAFLHDLGALRSYIPHSVAGQVSEHLPELQTMINHLGVVYGPTTDVQQSAAWMSYLLSVVRVLQCSDERDKVFAIIGVANAFSLKVNELVRPDYNETTPNIYISIMTAILTNSRYLSILAHVGDLAAHQLTDLPSWVVDYSLTSPSNPILALGKSPSQFDASFASRLTLAPRGIEGMRLKLSGAAFDDVGSVSLVTVGEIIAGTRSLEALLGFFSPLPDRYVNGQSRGEVLWRTMMFDSEENSNGIVHPAPASYSEAFKAWIINMISLWVADEIRAGKEECVAFESAKKSYAHFYEGASFGAEKDFENDEAATLHYRTQMLPYVLLINNKGFGRKLFKTDLNFVGMSSISVQTGDQIWLIQGCKTPLILRPKKPTSEFLLVGEAYLHGFMHGEMLDDRWKLKERIGPVTLV